MLVSRTVPNRLLRRSWNWITPVIDPQRVFTGLTEYAHYLSDWRQYSRLRGAESLNLNNAMPQLHDRTTTHELDAHYFYVNGWAMRRIVKSGVAKHVDVASETMFANLLSAVIPVTFMDYRPLQARLDGLHCIEGNILAMPFANDSVESLSCLHVAEHIGLGRYGDPLKPTGTRDAARELARVLAPAGSLFFAVPVGKPRLCFNAHRIHDPATICQYFKDLELVEFAGVHDDGRFVEHSNISAFQDSTYACGMFWFRKPASLSSHP